MSKLQDIDTQITECKSKITDYNKEMWNIYAKINANKKALKALTKEKEDILFELVCDYVDVGEELQIPNIRYTRKSIMKTGDTIRVVRKNAKSINIQIVATTARYIQTDKTDPRIGKISRVQPHIFGRTIYSIPGIKKAVERNGALKELLG